MSLSLLGLLALKSTPQPNECFCHQLHLWAVEQPYQSVLWAIILKKSEKAMATHSSTLAWKIPWMEETGGLQSMGLRRVRDDRATSLSLFNFMHWRRKWQPTQCSCLENPRDGGAWWAAVYGVAQSRTRLKRLSSSSSLKKCVCHGCLFNSTVAQNNLGKV